MKRNSKLDEQKEKDLAFSLETGLKHEPLDPYYLAVAINHAEKVVKSGNKVKIVSKWKGEEDASFCKEFVPDTDFKGDLSPRTVIIEGKKHTYTPKPQKRCGKPVTHQVSWETPRFYGTKLCTDTFCETHARNWLNYLKRGNSKTTNPQIRKI